MHPRLSLENTPACVEQIKALQACHADTNYWIKLMGACNEKKMVLDKCFRAQKKGKLKVSLEKARADRAKVEAIWKQHDDGEAVRRQENRAGWCRMLQPKAQHIP